MLAIATRSLTRTSVAQGPLAFGSVFRQGSRNVTTLSKALYTAKAQATGQGRNGVAHLTADGPFEVKLA